MFTLKSGRPELLKITTMSNPYRTGSTASNAYWDHPNAHGRGRKKSRLLAALLAFFLGGFGVHNFYWGYSSRAVTQLLLMVFGWATTPIILGYAVLFPLYLWIIADFILIVLGIGRYSQR